MPKKRSSALSLAKSDPLTVPSLTQLFTSAGYTVTDDFVLGLSRYLRLLLHWNQAINLTAAASIQELIHKHVLDSLILAEAFARLPLTDASDIADLGAGAGFPGIPLRLLWSAGTYVLIEKLHKRAVFLRTVLGTLELARTHVLEESVEELVGERRGTFHLIVSKAFLPVQNLLPLAGQLLNDGGWLAILSSHSSTVLSTVLSPDTLRSWALVREIHYTIPGQDRWIWLLSPTPSGA